MCEVDSTFLEQISMSCVCYCSPALAKGDGHIPWLHFDCGCSMDAFIWCETEVVKWWVAVFYLSTEKNCTVQYSQDTLHAMFFTCHRLVLDYLVFPCPIVNFVYCTVLLHDKVWCVSCQKWPELLDHGVIFLLGIAASHCHHDVICSLLQTCPHVIIYCLLWWMNHFLNNGLNLQLLSVRLLWHHCIIQV